MLVKPKVCLPQTLLLHISGKLSSKNQSCLYSKITDIFVIQNYSKSSIQSVDLMGRVGFFRAMPSNEKKIPIPGISKPLEAFGLRREEHKFSEI